MSRIIRTLKHGSDFINDALAPVDLDGARPVPSLLSKQLEDLDETVRRGPRASLRDLPAYIDAAKNANGVGLDDRQFLLEKLIVLMSRSPDDSPFATKLQQILLDTLYKDLPHPVSSYLAVPVSAPAANLSSSSEGVKYAYRSTDGSNYNPLFPSMGRAGAPYARSVPSTNFTPVSALPDPGLVFDTLLRRDKFEAHPGGISSLFFAFADLVIHSVFNTNSRDWTINDASSYLDLSPLYGSSEAQVNSVRRKDGTGRLRNDVFADSRLLFMPPAVGALLVLLNRNHNFIAEKILDINERGNLVSPPPTDEKARLMQDDEIFHRSRLVNTGFFTQIILGDYVGAILGLVRDGLYWRLNPCETMRQIDHEFAPQGEGNVVSLEFNFLYRWHATLSAQDTEWTENTFNMLFEGKDYSSIDVDDFRNAAYKLIPKQNVEEWTFNNLKRDAEGRFNDDDLAFILQNATEYSAGAFKARGTPEVLRVIEILAIKQSRSWGTCSLNEFRKFMGLKPYDSFKAWNSDHEIHTAAEALYHDIDNLELHVGLQAEEAKKPMPGAGLCPGYTMSRAILADAVCLTRGDRFLTVDFTPFNLTSWGYQDCQYDKNDGSYGGMLTKLLFRTLPNHYPAGSAYAHFPFLVPSYIKRELQKLPDTPVDKYTWTRPPVPKGTVVVGSYESVSQVLTDNECFASEYNKRISAITKGATLDHALVTDLLLVDIQRWRLWFSKTAGQLIADKSVDHIGSKKRYVDIVKDVINLLPIHWVATEIVGLDLKTDRNIKGEYREQQLYDMFADVCSYVYLNIHPVHDWTLRENSAKTFDAVIRRLKIHLGKLSKGILSVDGFQNSLLRLIAGANDHSDEFLQKLLDASKRRSQEDLAASLFTVVIPAVALYSQGIAHIVYFYLDDSRHDAREDIVRLCASEKPEAANKVLAYIHEALRLDPPVSGTYRTAQEDRTLGSTKVRSGEHVFVSVSRANLDSHVFGPDPILAMYDRPAQMTGLWNLGEHGILSSKFFDATAPEIIRVIFSLKNLTRAPGTSGELNRFTQDLHGTPQQLYINSRGKVTPWAPSLVVQYEV